MRRRRREDGLALVWLGLTLVLLIGMAGFGTDLGWLYLNTSRAQKAADSAALAGVVNLPGFPILAESDAKDAARANGYDPDGADTLVVTPLSEDRLHVELHTRIDTFFLKVLGFDHFDITREATSEYLKPIPLGSPNPCFGQDGNGAICDPNPTDFWAAVSAPFTRKEDGDPFSTQCNPNASASSCAVANPDFNRGVGGYNGYYYGVEVPEGSENLTVSIFDARFDERPNYPDVETADARLSWPGGPNPGVTTHFQLHEVDTSPSDPTNNPPIGGCAMDLDPDIDPGVASPETNQWTTLCSVGSPTPGIYMLHVWSSGEGSGTNQFAVGAQSTSGGPLRVYGINDMSIFSNRLVPGSPSQLYLAEIEEAHAGKMLELEFFDAGDAQGHSEMHVRDPFGQLPPNCTYEIWNHDQSSLIDTGNGCSWVTSDPPNIQIFNNQWIKALIDLPDDPEDMCNEALGELLACFWHMELALSDPNERTTWRARVIGNPVRLIPDPEPEPEPGP
jgi:hypothetical protein